MIKNIRQIYICLDISGAIMSYNIKCRPNCHEFENEYYNYLK